MHATQNEILPLRCACNKRHVKATPNTIPCSKGFTWILYAIYKAAFVEPSRVNFPLRYRLRKRQRARSAIRLRLVNTTTDPAEAMGNFLFDDDIKFRIEIDKTQSRVVDLIVSTLRLSNFDIVASYVLGPDACYCKCWKQCPWSSNIGFTKITRGIRCMVSI
nr:probable transmembrane GTPase FZO-like, chloroplastic [Tanacetum cinerariifolium]